MGIFEGCLLACDIDGTLMESGYINPKNIEKIEEFMSEGGMFSISTGRSIGAISDVLAVIKNISPSVVANGCMVYDYNNDEIIFETVLPQSEHCFAKFIKDLDFDIGIEIHCGPEVYTLKRNERTTLHQVYEKFQAPDIEFDDIDSYKWHKAVFIFNCPEDRERVKELLSDMDKNSVFIDTSVIINGEFQYYIEQLPMGVSKAYSLKKLCESFSIKDDGLFAIGDYYNDIEMLKLADVSAVPVASPDDVKELAEHITCSCKDGAVADFIEYLKGKINA